jgi:ribonuclease HIII
MSPTHFKTKLSSTTQQQQYKNKALASSQWHWQEKAEQHCRYRLDGEAGALGWVRLKQFNNGTLYLEGANAEALNAFLRVLGLAEAQTAEVRPALGASPSKAVANKASLILTASGGLSQTYLAQQTYIGNDESGKGDYFGPLVIASVYVTPQQAKILEAKGIKDCKALTNASVMTLAEVIAETLGLQQIGLVELLPATYNQVYEDTKAQGQNLNHLLAKAHTSALAALWQKNGTHWPENEKLLAIIDRFANESLIMNALPKALAPKLHVHQETKAEKYMAVAAASIIARHRFITAIAKLAEQVGHPLPLGAGSPVLQAARSLVRQQGAAVLRQVAKLHFKTTQQVLL